MILTKELLTKLQACQDGIDFCEKYKLFGFDLNNLDQITGDYNGYIQWLKDITNDNDYTVTDNTGDWSKYQYDNNNNLIRFEDSTGYWHEQEYDTNNNLIKKSYNSNFWEKWYYDTNNNLIKYENADNDYINYQYDHHNKMIKITEYNDYFNTTTETYPEYYDNGQLKQLDDLFIPFIDNQ